MEAICTLVEHKADVRAVTEANSLETPLHIAARSGRVDTVQRLMCCEIDLLPRTKVRQTDSSDSERLLRQRRANVISTDVAQCHFYKADLDAPHRVILILYCCITTAVTLLN